MDSDLFKLLLSDIPNMAKHNLGFLEITRQSHRETTNSNVYSYFLNQSNDLQTANLFLNGLLRIINDAKFNTIDTFECFTEVSTDKGNRIDLLVKDTDSDYSIIIENKIYHHLNNDLLDYWDSVKCKEDNKIGILLTLNKHTIPFEMKGKFINVTHIEWVNSIKAIGLPSSLELRQYVYLNDFFNTIEQITKAENMNEQAKFFFEHSNQITKAIETYKEANLFIVNELSKVAADLNWVLYSNNKNCWREIWDQANAAQAYYVVFYEDLMSPKRSIKIILELYKEAYHRTNELDTAIKDKNLRIDRLIKSNWVGSGKKHYYFQEYLLTMEELSNLSNFVATKIQEDFTDLMKTVLETLESKIKIV